MVVPKTVPVVGKAQTDVTLAALRVFVPVNDILCDIWTRKISIGTNKIFVQPAIPVTGLGVFIWFGLDVHIITDWAVIGSSASSLLIAVSLSSDSISNSLSPFWITFCSLLS